MSAPEERAAVVAMVDKLVARHKTLTIPLVNDLVDEFSVMLAAHAQRLAEARAALANMVELASGLDEDDPWFGERRNAKELIAAASEVLARLAPPA